MLKYAYEKWFAEAPTIFVILPSLVSFFNPASYRFWTNIGQQKKSHDDAFLFIFSFKTREKPQKYS